MKFRIVCLLCKKIIQDGDGLETSAICDECQKKLKGKEETKNTNNAPPSE